MARRPVILVAALLALVGATPSAAFESTTAHTAPRAPNRAGAFRAGQVGGTGLAISSGAGLAAKLGGRALTRAALMAAGGGATNALLGAVGALFNCDPYDANDIIQRFAVGAAGGLGFAGLRYLRSAAKGGRVLPRMAGGAPLPEEIIRPGGSLIGRAGRSPGIREVDTPGEVDDLFEQIRIHGTPTKSAYAGEGYDLPGGGFVGRRISEKYGPTLDLNLPGVEDIFKVHVRH
jgi:hypothetical protein